MVTSQVSSLTSTITRLVRPRQTGRIQVVSGTVRLENHKAPLTASSACSSAQNTLVKEPD